MATVRTIEIGSWSKFRELVDGPDFSSWTFRGQRDANWRLDTAITRRLRDAGVHAGAWRRQEERILRIFRRKAHLFLDHVPDPTDSFQWLALMQHHGAPTRLLDFTWSGYVAAFFALERATGDAAVWAICPPKANDGLDAVLGPLTMLSPDQFNFRGVGNFENFFLPGTHPIVLVGEPYVMNKRLIAQKGTFAVPGMIDRSLDEILTVRPDADRIIVKMVLRTSLLRRDAMRSLYDMNITNATLFPDLDGLARSLAYELEFHWAFDPYTMKPVPAFA